MTRGIKGNEVANQLPRSLSGCPLMGPDLACGILVGVAKQTIRILKNRDKQEYWKSVPGQETW